jgi:ribosome-associated translation inhibitor RaiA
MKVNDSIMMLLIHTHGTTVSDQLKEHTEAKVRLTLGLYVEKIKRADIYLTDINGPKGGDDMQCKIKIDAYGQSPFVVQQTATTLTDAINACSHRVKRTVARRLALTSKRSKYRLPEMSSDIDS